jgi:hypothetical protein
MLVSNVVPSFRNSQWLKLCIASVADQEGVEFEHIVQDACSDAGPQECSPTTGASAGSSKKISVCTMLSTEAIDVLKGRSLRSLIAMNDTYLMPSERCTASSNSTRRSKLPLPEQS